MNLALFDLDGTITRKDTFIEFLKFSVSPFTLTVGAAVLAGATWRYFRKQLPNDQYKERVLTHFFGGWDVDKFRNLAESYSRTGLPEIVKSSAMERIVWHREQEDRIIVVSASIRFWLEPWCRTHGLDLICTELEVTDGRITGRLATPNCYGPEKVRRIRAELTLEDYGMVYAYGDSGGDREMLALADKPHFRVFT